MSNKSETSPPPSVCHAFRDDALGQDDAVGLAEKLQKGELSTRELADAAIERAHLVEDTLQAVDRDCFELPCHEQKANASVFQGVPTFIKDNISVKGLPTGFGSRALSPKPSKQHDAYAKQYMKLGFHLLGKSSMPEFGLNATTEPAHKPPTRNPWNTDHSCGASSGGSAALVAAGVVPIAHGNDGGGSIRIPAACCGLVGLKPSRGRHMDTAMAKQLPINIVSEGVLTRSVRDTAYFHHEMQRYFKNKTLPPIGLITHPGKKRLRIGFVTDSISGYSTDRPTREAIEDTATLLEQMNHDVTTVRFPAPARFADDFAFYWAMMAFMLKHTGKLSVDSSFYAPWLDDFTHGLASFYKKQAYKTPLVLYRLKQHAQQFQSVFESYDVLMTPTLAHTTPALKHLSPSQPFDALFDRLTQYVGFTPMSNVAGTPAISLPLGHTENNLPIGVQFCGGLGREGTLLALAYELEEARPWRQINSGRL